MPPAAERATTLSQQRRPTREQGGVGGAGVHDALAEVLVTLRLYMKALLRPCMKDV